MDREISEMHGLLDQGVWEGYKLNLSLRVASVLSPPVQYLFTCKRVSFTHFAFVFRLQVLQAIDSWPLCGPKRLWSTPTPLALTAHKLRQLRNERQAVEQCIGGKARCRCLPYPSSRS